MFAIGDLVDYRGQMSHIAGTVESIVDEDFVMVREYFEGGPSDNGKCRAPLLNRMRVTKIAPHRCGMHCDCP